MQPTEDMKDDLVEEEILRTPLKTYLYFGLSLLGIVFLTYLMAYAWILI